MNTERKISEPVLVGDIIIKILAELKPDYSKRVIRTTCVTKEPLGRMLKRLKVCGYSI